MGALQCRLLLCKSELRGSVGTTEPHDNFSDAQCELAESMGCAIPMYLSNAIPAKSIEFAGGQCCHW